MESCHCLHCGRSALYKTIINDQVIPFCCGGCESVYKLLKADGFGKYYSILGGLSRRAPSQSSLQELDLLVQGMSLNVDPNQFRYNMSPTSYAIFFPAFNCAACLWLVEKVLGRTKEINSFRVHLDDRLLILNIDPADAKQVIEEVLRSLSKLGYHGVAYASGAKDEANQAASKKRLVHLGIAGALFANVMLFSSSVYLGQLFTGPMTFKHYFDVFSLGLATLSVATSGRSLFENSWRGLKAGILHIDLPIVGAVLVAWCTSVYHILVGQDGVYFDSITGLIFFLLLGRYLSESLIARARHFAGSAAQILPRAGAQLNIGDEVAIDHGMVVPADGLVMGGCAEISESFITGESRSVSKGAGEAVFGGTMNFGSLFHMRVTASGENTWLAQMERLVGELTLQRSHTERKTDLIARWFVAGTILLAVWGAFLGRSSGFAGSFETVCALLIVSCPCALAMAIPLANALAVKRGWHRGIVIRNIDAFETARSIDTLVFDKTGTLTSGYLTVVATHMCMGKIPWTEQYLSSMTRGCTHPVAKAIHRWSEAKGGAASTEFTSQTSPGRGMLFSGMISEFSDGIGQPAKFYMGSLKWVLENARSAEVQAFVSALQANQNYSNSGRSMSAVLICVGDAMLPHKSEAVVVFEMQDRIRPEAKMVIDEARKCGFQVRLLSGDQLGSALDVGKSLGFKEDEIFAEKLPDQKIQIVDQLKQDGHQVMMIGDGVNDAAVMQHAAIGVSMFGGADVTVQNADVFFTRKDLQGVLEIVDFSKYHFRTVWIILGLSLVYNLTAVTLVLSGHIYPFTAALIMPLSSLTVLMVAAVRKGGTKWKSSMSLCLLP